MFLDQTQENIHYEEDRTVPSFKKIQTHQTFTNKLNNYPLVAGESHDRGNFQKKGIDEYYLEMEEPSLHAS